MSCSVGSCSRSGGTTTRAILWLTPSTLTVRGSPSRMAWIISGTWAAVRIQSGATSVPEPRPPTKHTASSGSASSTYLDSSTSCLIARPRNRKPASA